MIYVVFALGWAVNLLCLWHLWFRAEGGLGKKLLFTVAQAMPILGALVYGGLYTPPKAHEENPKQPKMHSTAGRGLGF